MAEYKLDVNGMVGLSDYSNIHDCMGLIDMNGKLIITMKKSDLENAEIIAGMLKHNNFTVIEEGEREDGKYYITAYRNK